MYVILVFNLLPFCIVMRSLIVCLLFVILRYNILNPKVTKGLEDDHKQASMELLTEVNLEAEKYRMGHTKACSPSTTSPLLLRCCCLKEQLCLRVVIVRWILVAPIVSKKTFC